MTDTLLPPAISRNATCAELIVWLRLVLDRLDCLLDSLDVDPSDHTEAGQYVYQAGKVAARLGYSDLAIEASRLAPIIDASVFGFATPACPPISAYGFSTNLLGRCLSSSTTTIHAGATEKRSRSMRPAAQKSYAWFKRAEQTLGRPVTTPEAYDWARRQGKVSGMPDLDINKKSFGRNVRTAKEWLKKQSLR